MTDPLAIPCAALAVALGVVAMVTTGNLVLAILVAVFMGLVVCGRINTYT